MDKSPLPLDYHTPQEPPRKQPFTMIEIVIILLLVAFLIAILLPAFSKA